MKTNKRHHYRITKPFRFFVFIFICIMVVTFTIYGIAGAADADAAAVKTYKQVVIQEDDTLWSIAETCNPDANINVNKVVHEIYEINDITANDVYPGDEIFVPIY